MIDLIGDSQRKSRYDPNLAEQFNREVELEEKQEALKNKQKGKVQSPEPTIVNPNHQAEQKKDYVFVPSLGLYVSENRYLQNKNWNETQDILHKEGRRMPTIPEFVKFLKYLRSDEGKKQVKNAEAILDDIYTVREPYRAEWLDADFKVKGKRLYVNYHVFENNKIVQKTEELDKCLMQDKQPGIDLESWLENPTKQGLPKADVNDGSIWYWFPRSDNNSVAGFGAGSDWAGLDCVRSPGGRYAGLGVRYVEARSAEDRPKNGGKS